MPSTVAMKGRTIARPWLEGFRASDLVVLERLRAVPDIVRRGSAGSGCQGAVFLEMKRYRAVPKD